MTRDEQITSLVPLALKKTDKVMYQRGIPRSYRDDAVSDGLFALIKAFDAHDPHRGPLKPYIELRVEGGITDGIRSWTGVRTELRDGVVHIKRSSHETLSLDAPLDDGGTLSDVIADEVDDISQVETRLTLQAVLALLSPEDRALLVECFLQERGFSAMARARGTTDYFVKKAVTEALGRAQRIAKGCSLRRAA